jgi:D-alanine--poly(phosphoribitol) ligase subunit 1
MLVNVTEYLDRTAGRLPNKVAVADAGGSYTFSALRQRALHLAAVLTSRKEALNTPVGVYLPKCKEAIASFAGILYSGNCYAPLDVKSPIPRLESILRNLQPTHVITDRAHAGALAQAGYDAASIVLIEELDQALPADPSIERRNAVIIDTDPVYVIHTSGSTGIPKGVTIPHRGVIDYIEWALDTYRVDDSAVIGSQAPFHFDNSTLDIYLCFAAGATLVLVPDEKYLFPAKLLEHLRETGVNFIFWVPSVLVSVANLDLLAQVELPPLKQILFAGEVMPTRHLNYWRKWFPSALLSNLYGPTEITVDCTYYIVERELADHEPLPIGFPCRNSDILILNERNERCAPGERGELCVRGSSLALGYWNDAEKTAAAFCQNPLQPHYPERIYRTGDVVYTNELGEIIFAGRNDGQIKHMGYRIELGEVETAVLSLPEIRNACVLYDQDRSRIVLLYEADAAIEMGRIRVALTRMLPKYMLPSASIHFPSLPLNANGKIDRKTLSGKLGALA